jgi:hypothetical protein
MSATMQRARFFASRILKLMRKPPPECEDDEECSVLVRMPVGVKRAIAVVSKAEHMRQHRTPSMNSWIVDALATAAGMKPEPVSVIVGHHWRLKGSDSSEGGRG